MGRKLFTAAALLGACATTLMTAPASAQNTRISASEKGSLLIYTKIDVCYNNDDGTTLYADSYVTMNNDEGVDVNIICYFVAVDVDYDNDDDLGDDFINEAECFGLDFGFELTANQPVWWRASDGTTSGGAGFAPAFPGELEEFNGYFCRRGFIVCWAVNEDNEEIRFNHLSGGVTVVDTNVDIAFEYTAYAAAVISATVQGAATGTPGDLYLGDPVGPIAAEYASGFDFVLVDFWAQGANPFPGGTLTTFLWLMPLDIDFRQIGEPVITKAEILIWNENEFKISGTKRCFACWFQDALSEWSTEDMVNGFLRTTLNTDKGRARIDGVAHNSEIAPPFCFLDFEEDDELPIGADPRDILSIDTSLVGGSAKYIQFGGDFAASATHLVGTGNQSALMQWDHDAVGGGGGGSPESEPTPAPIVKQVDQVVNKAKKNRK